MMVNPICVFQQENKGALSALIVQTGRFLMNQTILRVKL